MTEAKAKTIYELFAEVKREVGPVGKTGRNTKQNYDFRGIDAVVNAAAPALDKHGVLTVPILQAVEYGTVEVGGNRTPMGHVRVTVTYRFTGPAGDSFDATVPGEAMDSGDKATAKAMSVAYRIALLQALNLPTSDVDPDSQNYERSPRQRPQEEAGPSEPSADVDDGDWGVWHDIIKDITTPEEADQADQDLREVFKTGAMGPTKAGNIRAAIKKRKAEVAGPPSPNGKRREEVPA